MTTVRIQASEVIPDDVSDDYEGQITFTPLDFAVAHFDSNPSTVWAKFKEGAGAKTVTLTESVPYLITITGDRVERFRVALIPKSGAEVAYSSLQLIRPASVRPQHLKEAAYVSTLRTLSSGGGEGASIQWADIVDAPDIDGLTTQIAGKANASHTHVVGNVTGLQTALDGKAPTSHNHPMGNVTGLQAALDGKAEASHNHTVAQVTGLQGALDGKAPTSHNHTVAQVTGLQASLDGKAATSHTHTVAQITGLQAIIDDLTARLEALETPEA